jgi:hypothetical protein
MTVIGTPQTLCLEIVQSSLSAVILVNLSLPQDGNQVTSSICEINLFFNSSIETNHCSVAL